MSKHSKKGRTKHSRKTNPQKQSKKQGLLSKICALLSPTGWFCASIVFCITIVTAYYVFSFKLVLTPSKPLDPSNPFSTPFILKNDSLLWIKLVSPFESSLIKVTTYDGSTFNNCGISTTKPSIPILDSGESTSFMPSININKLFAGVGQIKYADVEIIISYYPAIFPSFIIFERKFRERFVTYQSKDGTLHWEHKAKSIKIDPK